MMMQSNIMALRDMTPVPLPDGNTKAGPQWLERFHDGERPVMEAIYREQFQTVETAVGRVLSGADRETAVHEVFLKLINSEALRRSFQGGDLAAWLAVVGRNHAIDYVRRRSREAPSGIDLGCADADPHAFSRSSEARLLVERFQRDVLPPQWRGVFEARLLQNMSQTEAAAALGVRRTTLAYQELRIRQLLRKFLLKDAP
jgi:RNA polymerase sigma-70 factor, ECF subfamily